MGVGRVTRRRFELIGGPGTYRVLLDGEDIAPAVRAVTVEATGRDELPRVALDLAIVELGTVSLPEASVYIPDATRDLLVKLGWTPPGGQARQP